ncbi:MAG: peptidoglycan-binding protein [Candidatus Omnitrophica bacterium]|nr:peptidoglycan-binding protein [Candidatus Omnitrophota bacterium]
MAKTLILIVCCFILSGCATTRGTPSLEMQSRIDYLEDEIKTKNYKIEKMENELRQVKQAYISKQNEAGIAAKRSKKQTVSAAKVNADESKEIIRVSGVTALQVQSALKKAGFYQGKIDGKIGSKTKAAIKAFQRKNNLKVDGVVGQGTWTKLKKNN